jgi:predicted component of type VI protein secretion system
MPYVQILSGSRANDVIELNPSASLIVGSAQDAHIQLSDADVVPNHCQIYPAQEAYWLQDLGEGLTVLNTHRLAGTTEGLRPNDVFILGQTFLRFLTQKPVGAGGGGDAQLQAEVERLTAAGRKGEELTLALGEKLRSAKSTLETLREQVGERDKEIEGLRSGYGGMESQVGGLAQQVKVLQHQLEAAKSQAATSEESFETLKSEVDKTKSELKETRKTSQLARVDAKRLKLEMGMSENQAKEDLLRARRDAEARVVEAEEIADDIEAELAATLSRLEASQAALEALGVQPAAEKLDLGEPEKLSEVLAGLGLPNDVMGHLEAGLAAHVDREALRRFSGPLLSWDRPQAATKLAEQVISLRTRAEELQLAFDMGVSPKP